ncbi:MAG: ZIP family metal transporter [Planctomycetaceae bacterium]
MHPLVAAATDQPVPVGLAVCLALVAAAAFAGGSSVSFLALGHRPMQVLLSLTGGVLLGVGLLHLLPHAAHALHDVEAAACWAAAGFFLMFLLERAFHGHSHHTADDGGHACGHAHDHDHHHAAGRWAWAGAFAGLALHRLADGAALAASVSADVAHGGGLLSGLATFLAVLLHKPFDAAIIATLMMQAGVTARGRTLVNAAYALVVPLGAVAFLASLRLLGPQQGQVLGVAMAMAAGAFICIAAADLLPEVQFHSHDRLLLTASLALGLAIAWGITVLERSSHAHARHGPAAAGRGH